MIKDAGLTALLTTRALAQSPSLAGNEMEVVYVDEWSKSRKRRVRISEPGGERAAARVFDLHFRLHRTTQSVMISHDAVLNLLRAMGDEPGLERTTACSPLPRSRLTSRHWNYFCL